MAGDLPAPLVGGAVVVLVYFEPQTLLFDTKVNEAAPVTATDQSGGGQSLKPSARGEFEGVAHPASGTALVIGEGAERYIRFENLQVDNGPDLKVYLSRAPASGPGDALNDDFVNLGDLKGNIGDQNYAIPADVDPAQFESVVIWCERFAVGFAVAPLDQT